MKKYTRIVFALICALSLVSCGSNKKISLPEPKNITEIEIIKNTSENIKTITKQDEISKIILEIKKNTKNTGRQSVGDQPTNIDDFIIIKFHHDDAEDSQSIAYIYNDKNISYIEQPYSGIWILKEEIFENISSYFN